MLGTLGTFPAGNWNYFGRTYMKTFFALATLMLGSTTAALGTQSDDFMKCHGAHHGWYLDFNAITGSASPDMVQLNITVSTDASPEESPYRTFTVESVEKNGQKVPVKSYRWVLKQAVTKGLEFGYIKVKAKNGNSVMYLNYNIFGDANLQNAVFIDGHMQSLTCTVK